MTALRAHADRTARLPDERDGRHPLRPAGDAAPARPDGGVRGPRAGGGAHRGGLGCRGGRGHRPPRAISSRSPADLPANVTRTPPASSRRCAALLDDNGYAGFSFHFDSIGGDGRFEQLPLLAASDLMADGYGFAAEGDTNTASLMCAGQTMIGDAHFSEMYAMDWELDSVLISHMGEGNWKIAREGSADQADRSPARDRPARQPAHAGVLGRAWRRHQRGAGAARGRDLPPGGGARRGARHTRAAQGRDALLPFPPRAGHARSSWTTG